jgi:cytosine/adenosine deaminase-related metal-dependent hydrolase
MYVLRAMIAYPLCPTLPLAARTLTVEGDHIVTIVATHSDPADAESPTQFSGGYMFPGFIDKHAHHSPPEAALYGLLFLVERRPQCGRTPHIVDIPEG